MRFSTSAAVQAGSLLASTLQLGVNAAALPAGKLAGYQRSESGRGYGGQCKQTKVVILGAGIAGITAAQALANQSISDFLIVEYQDDIGGRVINKPFGLNAATGEPFQVEHGANWAQGLGIGNGAPENPIWTFEKKHNISTRPSNFELIMSYNETGEVDFLSEIDAYEEAFAEMLVEAGELLTNNIQDRTVREGFSLVGWKPELREHPQAAEAVEWWLWDGEQATTPDESALIFGAAVSNFTFLQFSEENNFVIDQRGHNTWIKGEASEFLNQGTDGTYKNDPRLLLNTIVSNVSYSDDGVIVLAEDGSCISADYAILTFSIGVLQHEVITFEPEFPSWKKTSVESFQMGTYTKIFMQFPTNFWGTNEFFLYADPIQRGWYPIFQSLDAEGFFPGSSILFVTVVQRESYRVERMTNEQTQEEVMKVVRAMFPNVDVPDPLYIDYPRWTNTPWAYGSYSNWPPATTLEQHQNLRANVQRLWFAGEHTSSSYFGYMQGAWFEGRDVGSRIAGLVGGTCTNDGDEDGLVGGAGDVGACGEMVHYVVLHGTTTLDEYNIENGWDGTSFQTNGLGKEEEEEPLARRGEGMEKKRPQVGWAARNPRRAKAKAKA
ncbi:hypothetical protein EJ08DRAFT_646056 [Tothia fuscella]|uniref:Amine oxidase n=1 Tax=Tothia fuscella TaxID=1048955 RepID=A0A9P4P0I7_9PEZI|nr:hypothetical protein EJ08DRAFT_646056 [Tothia fuscella]